MKRFVVFYNPYFDAKGGFLDYLEDFDSLPQARKFAEGLLPSYKEAQPSGGWWQIADLKDRLIYLNNHQVFSFPNDGKFGRYNLKNNLKKTTFDS
jgi:hypothetical protein